jgi:SecD/SecF fusion protein
MNGKGLIQFFAVAMVIVCLYQLSFTVITYQVESDARQYAKEEFSDKLSESFLNQKFGDDKAARASFIDSVNNLIKQREQHYLDSMRNTVVFDLLFQDYTYKRCKQQEINLGLDLRGGMSVTLQVAMDELLSKMANNSDDPAFRQALQQAKEEQLKTDQDFITLFGQAFEEISSGGRLVGIFNTPTNDLSGDASNEEVLEYLRKESDNAINRTFNIIRTRIDRFGVSQPKLNLQEGSGRIIVELPGVDNPDRVRNLLQATANLQFWKTWENRQMIQHLSNANEALRSIKQAEDTTQVDTTEEVSEEMDLLSESEEEATDTAETATTDTSEEDEFGLLDDPSLADTGAGETEAPDTGALSQEEFQQENPLFAVLNPAIRTGQGGQQQAMEGPVVGYARGKDTSQVRKYLNKERVKAVLPNNVKFIWGAKPMQEENEVYALYAIKTKPANKNEAHLEGDVIVDASQDFDRNQQPNVSMTMNTRGAREWKRLTAEAARQDPKQSIAIVLDNRVYSAPRVQNEIAGGRSSITGNFTIEEAQDLANILKAGKLPAPATIIEEAVVGPSLGEESINSGLSSLAAGMVFVLLFMMFYYGTGGIVSDLALLLNLFFILGVLASLGAALTLPGIAGLVLTVGMAVDANVIIYERIREELLRGKGLRLAIIDGYKSSYSAIIDANLTTLFTALILAYFGLGPILGFAVVLIIGIVSSLFTAVLLTQMAFEWMIKKDWSITFSTKLTHGMLSNVDIDFLSKRKIAYTLSGLILAAGIGSIVVKGFELGVDFKGGRAYVIRFHEPVQSEKVRNALTERFNEKPLVRTFGAENQVKITTSYMIESPDKKADSIVQTHLFEGLQPFLGEGVGMEQFKDEFRMSSQKVGPTIAEDIKLSAIWATIFGLIVIFLYILMRFRKWQYGLGAIAAIFHDVLLVLGLFSIFRGIFPFSLEIDQAFIGALLTIIGYSINDTVVIFDRIREFLTIHPAKESHPVINNAMNRTLSRTIMTSVTSMIVILILFLFGGEMIQGFTFALLVGIITGTYSSLFVASPIMYDLAERAAKKK